MALLIGAESKGTVIRARGKLTAAGFIEFQPGKKGSPNCYRLKKQSQNVTANATVSETISATANEPLIKTIRNKTYTPLPPQGETGFGDDLQDAFESWALLQGGEATRIQADRIKVPHHRDSEQRTEIW